MEKSNRLQEWLDNKNDDLAPYYFNKLEFLKLYGTRCTTQMPTTPEECEKKTNNRDCIVGRELYCQYSQDKCAGVIDSICNYYDEKGNYIQEKFTESQVEYLDTLYKMAGSFEYGKFLSTDSAKQSIQTNAFQILYTKFNVGKEEGFNKSSCYSAIGDVMQSNAAVMEQIHKTREAAFKRFGLTYDTTEHQFVKLPELAMYVFEVLRKEKIPDGWLNRFKTIFTHDVELDKAILEIIKKEGICVQSTNPKRGEKMIPNDVTKLTKSDFELTQTPANSVLYNVVKKALDIAMQTTFYIGSIIVNIAQFLIQNYGNIAMAFMVIVCMQQFLGLLVDSSTLVDTTNEAIKTFYGESSITGLKKLIDVVKPIMPYLNVLYVHCRDILCVIMPVITSPRLIQSSFGIFIGNYIANVKVNRSIIPPNFITKLKDIAFVEVLIHVLQSEFLNCDKTIRAIGKDRAIVYVTDTETNIQRYIQFISEQFATGTTQPFFRDFMQDVFVNPLGNAKRLFLVLGSLISGSCFRQESPDEISQIAKEGAELIYTLFVEGPFAQETGATGLNNAIIGPVKSTFSMIGSYDFYNRVMEVFTLDALFYIAVVSGVVVGNKGRTVAKGGKMSRRKRRTRRRRRTRKEK